MTEFTHESHLLAVRHYAERGIARGGCVVEDGSGCWRLFISTGANVLREGPGAMFLWAQLSEIVVEEHEAISEYDSTETVARAHVRTTGEFDETIATIASWLLTNGWRAERGHLVSRERVEMHDARARDELHVVRRPRH